MRICRVADRLLPIQGMDRLEQYCQYDERALPSRVTVHPGDELEGQLERLKLNLDSQLRAYPDEWLGVLSARRTTRNAVANFLSQTDLRESVLLQSDDTDDREFDEERRIVVSNTTFGKRYGVSVSAFRRRGQVSSLHQRKGFHGRNARKNDPGCVSLGADGGCIRVRVGDEERAGPRGDTQMKTMRVAVVERVKLADILRGIGRPDSVAMDIGDAQLIAEPGPFRVGIGYVDGRFEAPPHFVVVPGPDRREFFAWVNTYCPFVTPLSQWCRVVTEPELALVRKARVPSYGGVEAAWAGAVIGEAVLRLGTGRRLAEMTTTALQTCATFVAARARGLWGVDDARWEWMAQYETARRTLGVGDRDSSLSNYRTVWEVLDALSDEGNEVVQAMEWRKRLIVQACADIRKMGFVREGTMLEVVGELGWPTVYHGIRKDGS